jgi:hypothetical protein
MEYFFYQCIEQFVVSFAQSIKFTKKGVSGSRLMISSIIRMLTAPHQMFVA